MIAIRETFLETARITAELIGLDATARAWDGASALDGYTVGGLAGHLARATLTVSAYLGAGEPDDGETMDPIAYFASALQTASPDQDIAFHAAVRNRAATEAARGNRDLTDRIAATIGTLHEQLSSEPALRRIAVLGDRMMFLDDYLVTRLVEQVVHGNDLALSVGVDPPDWPGEAIDLVLAAVVGLAAARHGAIAVITALARTEQTGVWPAAF